MGQNSFSVAATEINLLWRIIVMEKKKKKRERPKVDASLTETVYRESRRRYTNPEASVRESGATLMNYLSHI